MIFFRNSFLWAITVILLISGGFFVGQNYLLAAGDLPSHNGVMEDNPDWAYSACATTSAEYLILKYASSTLISPELDLSECSSSSLHFALKAYQGLSKTVSSSLLVIGVDSAGIWTDIGSYYATGTALSIQLPFDLSAYCGQTVKIRFTSPNATGYYGIGLDNISFEKVIKEATTTATSTATTTAQIINPNDLVINEVYPAPASGASEWVEIHNLTTSTLDLSGLYLLNLTGDSFVTTTLSGLINPDEYLVIEDIIGNLNNDGDTVVLRSDNQIIDQTTYGNFNGKSDASWARTETGDYTETIDITKNEVNAITVRPVVIRSSSGGSSYSPPKVELIIATTTIATTTASTTLEKYFERIIINEIYPNPSGPDTDDEFIELKNISDSDIDLTGLVLADASKNKHIIRASTTATSSNVISAGGYFAFYRSETDLALNNSGLETVKIMTSNLEIIDQIDYVGENEEGVSYSRRDDGKWRWVKTITPGKTNAEDELYVDQENPATISLDAAETIKASNKIKSIAKSKTYYQTISLDQLKEFTSGDLVKVRGVVSVVPGVLGSQYFYIAGSAAPATPERSDGGRGVQIYSNKKDFPELAIGDYIEVYGELSDTSAGRRIKTASRNQIKFIERQAVPEPHQLLTSEIGEEYEGYLAKISGDILEISGRNYIIDDGSGEAKVYFNNQINLKDIGAKEGDKITVVGIVGQTATGYRVMPRDLKDISVQKGEVKGDFVTTSSSSNQSNQLNYYLVALIIFLSAIILMLYFKLKNTPD